MKNLICPGCGMAAISTQSRFCIYCGASLKKRNPVGEFLFALLKCFLFWAAFQLIPGLVIAGYHVYVTAIMPIGAGISEALYEQAYWEQFSQYSAAVMIAADALLILSFALFYICRRKNFAREIHSFKMPFSSFGGTAVTGVAAQFAVTCALTMLYALFPAAQEMSPDLGGYYDQVFGNGSMAAQFAYIAVVTPLAEEIVFRGLMYTRLRAAVPKWAAILTSALIFGAAHGNLEQFLYTFLIGILLAAAFERYNSIWASFAIHFGFNAASYIVELIPISSIVQLAAVMLVSAGVLLFCIAFIYCTRPVYKNKTLPTKGNI